MLARSFAAISKRTSVARRCFSAEGGPYEHRAVSAETLATLKELFGDRVSTAASVREHHGTDESYHAPCPPDVVVYADSTEEVSTILKLCSATKTPLIPFGAGSCRVQCGVTRLQLESELRATGLFFPVDPGADATLGGMVATNASGTTTVRYGNMKSNVLGLTAVMADGRIIRTGSKARKSSAGYDLTRLLIGSEGTLAVVTEVELRLQGVPEAQKIAVCSFPTIQDAVDTCTVIMQMGIPVSRMELMDHKAIEATNKYSKLNNIVSPCLVIELNGTPEEIEHHTGTVQALAEDYSVQRMSWAASEEDRKELLKARHSAWYATMNLVPGSRALSTDVCVPLSNLTQVIVDTQADLEASGLVGTIVGHVGDGNFHVMLPFLHEDEPKVREFSDRLVERALAAEGTCTGEHGIGSGKIKYLRMEHGDSVDVMQTIKHALDPHNILNPSKLF
ncbi:hypothetical protein SPRG_21261 [Saprolegnia parasitica CBS 223.65]|uniref:D-lactate dehydrogenase (cytochrome) n=1 Tax=Saprolegnia parasitica (strain CBS 223.65) TaxID=695850 RepID=A0A067BPU7_SAPPC|nr:hypothetical protein SPRG_21261 [Saprolegnia parasitica CBS 223.65]KDO20534.1 hypothetical protein SPRG_21261 [Saprolegnia parasitica CBS 223.65]|eukprot:XP_012208757.1 hypothetical protein SPRG_21261 [Saprolegnia parasitica CBS 223.65]